MRAKLCPGHTHLHFRVSHSLCLFELRHLVGWGMVAALEKPCSVGAGRCTQAATDTEQRQRGGRHGGHNKSGAFTKVAYPAHEVSETQQTPRFDFCCFGLPPVCCCCVVLCVGIPLPCLALLRFLFSTLRPAVVCFGNASCSSSCCDHHRWSSSSRTSSSGCCASCWQRRSFRPQRPP